MPSVIRLWRNCGGWPVAVAPSVDGPRFFDRIKGRGCNSVGRVSASQAECRGFESLHPLLVKPTTNRDNRPGCDPAGCRFCRMGIGKFVEPRGHALRAGNAARGGASSSEGALWRVLLDVSVRRRRGTRSLMALAAGRERRYVSRTAAGFGRWEPWRQGGVTPSRAGAARRSGMTAAADDSSSWKENGTWQRRG